MKIHEGATVELYINGTCQEVIEVCQDIEIEKDQLFMQTNGVGLFSTDYFKPVEKIEDNRYRIYTWFQDAVAITRNGILKSISDID